MNNPIIVTDKTLQYYDSKLKGYIGSLFGCDMTVEWEPIVNGKNYFKLKIALKNKHGAELFSKIVDFPLEQTIVSGSYHNPTKSLILYFQDGTSTSVPIEDLIEGLASKLDLEKKANLGESYTDTSFNYIKDVPNTSATYAKITKIGGMTYKDGNTLKDTKVAEVKSVGINIWDEKWEAGYINSSGVNLNGYTDRIRNIGYIPCLPNTEYYVNSANAGLLINYYDNKKVFISQKWFNNNSETTPSNCYYMRFATDSTYGGMYKDDICINVFNANINGNYYPYTSHTLAIPESVQSLEGYGLGVDNTYYNYIDLASGLFVKNVGVVDISTLNWEYYNNYNFFAVNLGENQGNKFICSMYEKISAKTDPEMANVPNMTICVNRDDNGSWLNIKNTAYTNVNAFKSAMKSVYLVYKLATPTATSIDISDGLIGVEGEGTITFENEHGYGVPNEVIFYINDNDIVGANKFVGNLEGTAEAARYYEINGNISDKTIGDTLAQLLNVSNPIKVTTESVGVLATSNGQMQTLGVGIIANPPVAVNDIVLDKYFESDASYLCFWQVTHVDTGLVTLAPISNIYIGGGSASVADKAICDGENRNIAETYATAVMLNEEKAALNESIDDISLIAQSAYDTATEAKAVASEIKGTADNAYDRASVAINTAQDSLNRVNRGVQSVNADYTSGGGGIGSFYLRVNFVGGGSESYNITEGLRGLINDVLTYDR